jgi:hypothetical protein
MMLLRTLVLEHSGHDTPVNGALLCSFAVTQIASNFLAYSLDEETEPGSSRVYIAALRKKSERYFLGSIDSKEDLQLATQVFKQILTLAAASGATSGGMAEAQVPYHFVDLRGCKLPPARPEDHHSLTIKKALVMKLITLGTSAPGLPAIESSSLIVPSIRFSSQMVSAPKAASPIEPVTPPLPEPVEQAQSVAPAPHVAAAPQAPAEVPVAEVSQPQAALLQPVPDQPLVAAVREGRPSLFEVDDTLTNLARVAQELTQQKRTVLEQEEALVQARAQLQQEQAVFEQERQQATERAAEKDAALQLLAETLGHREAHLADGSELQQVAQHRMDERARHLENQAAQLHSHDLVVRHKAEQLAAALSQLPGLRENLLGLLHSLDETLARLGETDQGQGFPHSPDAS